MSLITILPIDKVSAEELNPTVYLQKKQPAPFDGYLVEPVRLEKSVHAVQELDVAQKFIEVQEQYYDAKAANEMLIEVKKWEAKQAETAAVEKALKEKVAEKSVWYRQPWFVATGVAALFITTGILIP